MVRFNLDACAALELAVILLQFAGLSALCLYRLFPDSRFAQHGRFAFVFALFGLGVTGALCGRLDSEFGLFAGGTMTVLLIGMIAGSARPSATRATGRVAAAESVLIG